MSDEVFMNERRSKVTQLLLAEFRTLNYKVAATYRKRLTASELSLVWICAAKKLFSWLAGCFCLPSLLTFLLPACWLDVCLGREDYEREVRKGVPANVVMVPTKDSLMASFATHPDDSTVEEAEGVSFFYHVAVATVKKRVTSPAL
jgi:hypothetical protein